MKQVFDLYKTTIGKKIVIALSGLILYGFVFSHMLGNLKAFAGFGANGVHKLDIYAVFLRVMGKNFLGYGTVLWIARGVLLVAVVAHVVTVIQLQILNKKSRPKDYKKYRYQASSWASRFMFYGGIILALFIIVHLLHITFGYYVKDWVEGHVYANIYAAFKNPIAVSFYMVAMAALSFHLYHGVWSMFQTLGLVSPDRNSIFRVVAIFSAVIIALGFISVPLSIFFGLLPEPSLNFIVAH